MLRLPACLSLILLSALPATALAGDLDGHAAHQHGVAQLTLVLEKNTVQIALESPADNIVGFEHAPAKPGEKAAVAAAMSTLRRPTLFGLNTEAGCGKARTQAGNPFDTSGNAAHRDFDVNHTFECSQPTRLNRLDANALFKAFPRLQSLKVDYALPGGQGSVTLTPASPNAMLVR